MRILIFHGYLLIGTGSNVYNAELGAALVRGGHEVHMLAQERSPFALDWVEAAGTWDSGSLVVESRVDGAPRATVYRPDIGGLLPVYVADVYDGIQARAFNDLSPAEVEHYVEANVAAVRDVVARARPDVALANHLVMGPAILARALDDVPYAVKVHGSALEYTVKPYPRFRPYAVEGLARARGVLVGSRHTAESLWAEMADETLPGRTRLGPPGVDVVRFAPRDEPEARAGLRALRDRLAALAAAWTSPPRAPTRASPAAAARASPAGAPALAIAASSPPAVAATPADPLSEPADEVEPDDLAPPVSSFARDVREAVAALDTVRDGDRLIVFVGKLIASKGVELLLAAFPRVLAREPRARLVIVGFGAFRDGLERLTAQLAAGDLDAAAADARRGRPRAPAARRVLRRPRGPGRLPRGRRGPRRARCVRRPPRSLRARRPAARRRGDGGHLDLPGGVRDGRGRGRRVRHAAGRGQPLRARRGRAHALRGGPRGRPRLALLRGRPGRGPRARRRAHGLARGTRRPPRADPRGDRRGDARPLLLGRRRPHGHRRRPRRARRPPAPP